MGAVIDSRLVQIQIVRVILTENLVESIAKAWIGSKSCILGFGLGKVYEYLMAM